MNKRDKIVEQIDNWEIVRGLILTNYDKRELADAIMEMDEWVSVEDRLPESDIPVIVYGKNRFECGRTLRAFYAAKFEVQQWDEDDWTDYDEKSDVFYLPVGWYENNEFDEVHYHIDFTVTHWIPLPEPPKPKKQ